MSKKTLAKSQQPKAKSPKPKVVKWEYVTKPFDVKVLPALFTRLHSPLTPWLSSLTENCYVHLRPCVQGVDEDGAVVKYLYCTRNGRFFVRGKDGWNEVKPADNYMYRSTPQKASHNGTSGCPRMVNFNNMTCHRCVAFAWLDVPKDVKLQMIGVDANGVPNTNQQSVCGGEEPRHTSPLCRPAASDATVLPKAWEVDHLNTDHKNWTADNLQWVTAEENRRRAKIAKRMRKKGLNPKWLQPQTLRLIYAFPDYKNDEFAWVDELLWEFEAECKGDCSELSIEAINLTVDSILNGIIHHQLGEEYLIFNR